jgi:hypothetical protein
MASDKAHVRVYNSDTPFVKWQIPVVTYEYEKQEELAKDLIYILDDLERFYRKNKASEATNDGGTSTESLLTSKYHLYNILDRTEYDSISEFKFFVTECFKSYLTEFTPFGTEGFNFQCWGNKIGKYDYLSKHQHTPDLNSTSLSGNYSIKSPGHTTYTHYYSFIEGLETSLFSIENKPGMLTIFPAFIPHSTTPNRSDKEFRYTLGIDAFAGLTDEDLADSCYVKLF